MGTTKVKMDVEEKPKEKRPAKAPKVEKKRELKTIVRVAGTDLDGEKPLIWALKGIKGISHTLSKSIVSVSGFDPYVKLGSLKEEEINKIESIINEPRKYAIPGYLLNRGKELESGKDIHLTGPALDVAKKFDIQRKIDMKTYQGIRHMLGLPVRGQRTRSSFRKGRVVGVIRKAVRMQMAAAGKEEKKEEKK